MAVTLKKYRYGRCVSLIVFLQLDHYQNLWNDPRKCEHLPYTIYIHYITYKSDIMLIFSLSVGVELVVYTQD